MGFTYMNKLYNILHYSVLKSLLFTWNPFYLIHPCQVYLILSKKQLLFSFLCIVKQKTISERSEFFWNFPFLKIYFIKNVWKVGFQFMLILGLLGMYFDAVVVFVTKSSLLFRLAVAILCYISHYLNGLI